MDRCDSCFLIHGDEDAEATMTPDDRRAIVGEHIRNAEMLRERGVYVLGEALELAGHVPVSPGVAVEVPTIVDA